MAAVDLSTAEGLAELAKRERIAGKRQRRAVASMRQRARVMFADGVPIDQIAKSLNVAESRVREAIETAKRMPASNREPDLQARCLPLFVSIGSVRRMIDPPPAYETIRRMLHRAGITVLVLSGRSDGRGAMRVISTHELTRFLERCKEAAPPLTSRERARLRDAAAIAREAKARQTAANQIARMRERAAVLQLTEPAPAGPKPVSGGSIRNL